MEVRNDPENFHQCVQFLLAISVQTMINPDISYSKTCVCLLDLILYVPSTIFQL